MLGDLQYLVLTAISLIAFVGALYGLIDVARRPAGAFAPPVRGSKVLWIAILGAATVVTFLGLPPMSLGGVFSILGIASIAATIFYFVDVREKLGPHRRGGSSRGGSSRGGW